MFGGWDETDEVRGWGEDANSDLLDAVEAGMPALLRYADEVEGLTMPSVAEVLELLAEAEREAEKVPGEDARWNAEVAVRKLRAQLTVAPALAVAA